MRQTLRDLPRRSSKMASTYGPHLRLWGIDKSQIPEKTATPTELTPFLTSLLLQAVPFINNIPPEQKSMPESPWHPKGIKTFPNSEAPVQCFERTVPAAELQSVREAHKLPQLKVDEKAHAESWFLRRSTHVNMKTNRTANWDEFKMCFKEEHAQAEKEFTPSVISTEVLQEWNCDDIIIELDGDTYVDWTLKVEQSTHKLPPPLKLRLFPVIQATASITSRNEFIVIQIAYRDLEAESKPGDKVRAAYSSIERCREVDEGRHIEWIMGTTSDAKGSLPGFVQKFAMPGAIAKDVDMFLGWIGKQRVEKKGKGKDGTNGHSQGVTNGGTNGFGTNGATNGAAKNEVPPAVQNEGMDTREDEGPMGETQPGQAPVMQRTRSA